jgi:hypothetical protein
LGDKERRHIVGSVVNPEDTDKHRRFEDVVARITNAPKDDLDKAEAPKTAATEEPSDAVSPDPRD